MLAIIISQMGSVVVPTSLDWGRAECTGACKMPCPMLSSVTGPPWMLPGNGGGEKSGFIGIIICLLFVC